MTVKELIVKLLDEDINSEISLSFDVSSDLVLVPRNRYNELMKARRYYRKLEEKTDYPFDPNVPEMGQL